jgi:hypothetical protein
MLRVSYHFQLQTISLVGLPEVAMPIYKDPFVRYMVPPEVLLHFDLLFSTSWKNNLNKIVQQKVEYRKLPGAKHL